MALAEFDPDAGVLRLDHAAMSVLATLAVRPTDPALHDHAVAPVVDVLRRAGLVGRRGLPPDVAAMMTAVGSPDRALRLAAQDHGAMRAARLWAGRDLVVVGVQEDDGAYSMMADRVSAAADLVGELVGLAPAPEPTVGGEGILHAAGWLAALTGAGTASFEDVVVRAPGPDWIPQLERLARAAAVHWALFVTGPEASNGPVLVVVDGGGEGLWWGRPVEPAGLGDPALRFGPTTPPEVRNALADQLGVPLR